MVFGFFLNPIHLLNTVALAVPENLHRFWCSELTMLTRSYTLTNMTKPTTKPVSKIDLRGIERATRMLLTYPEDPESVEFWTSSLKSWAKKILD